MNILWYSHANVVRGITLADTSFSGKGANAAIERLAVELGVPVENIHSAKQVHGVGVATPDTWHRGIEADALIEHRPGYVVGVTVADCCAILIAHNTLPIVAAVHSGWRGTARNIIGNTIQALVRTYSIHAEHLSAHLSACACARCYEVGADVRNLLPDYCTESALRADKWYFDNRRAIEAQLRNSGVEAITIASECTIENAQYHSHRRDAARAGRCFGFVGVTTPGE